ncbi:MAG: trypsin-like peptidase domain-containing protein [Candidatus Poribacteria bacterium]|nr:trypsin-like peptidase domain-containing protein [Candidatus Poribacteria bacterium]
MEQEMDTALQQIAEDALKNSVVCLNVERETPCLASRPQFALVKIETNNGSGFFIDKHLIVTNFHVIVGATSVTIKLSGHEEAYQIESVEAYDEKNDLILLNVDNEGVPLTLGDSDTVQDEDEICAVGYPNDQTEIEHGTIESIWKRPGGDLIRLSTKSTGGSSGSPILNSKGEVIGVKSSSRIDASGNIVCGYAIPSNRLKKFLQDRTESVPFDEWQELPEVRYLAQIDAAERFLKDGDYKEAIAYYDIAIELKPDMVKAYRGRADARMELWAFSGAAEDLITVRRLDPVSFSFSNFRKYFSWKRQGLWVYGGYFLIKSLRTIFGKSGWFRFKGIVKFGVAKSEANKGDKTEAKMMYQESVYDFTEAINLKPKVAGIYNHRGWTKCLLGQLETEQGNEPNAHRLYQEAISDGDSALELETKDSKSKAAYYHTRGAAKAGLGDHDGAIDDFTESIRLRPKKARYYHDRGLSNEAIGQHEAAEADFAKAKELDPNFENKSAR